MLTPFGQQIRKIRIDRRLRLLDMAEALGVTATFVSAVETGKKAIPEGFEREISKALKLSEDEAVALIGAADRTRKEVKVGRLAPSEKELVAAFARRVDGMTEAELEVLRKLVFKMAGDEVAFHRRRRGHLVPARSTASIWDAADTVRSIFMKDDDTAFPVMDVLEFRLQTFLPGFYIEVVSRDELDGDEANAVPAENTILFADDVYKDAWRGIGRARFTAAHELGHLLLHAKVLMPRSSENFPIFRDAEWQADSFAGSLLMSRKHASKFNHPHEMAVACGVTLNAADVMWSKYAEKGIVPPVGNDGDTTW